MRAALIAIPLLLLAACEGGGDPVEQAMRDASAERHAATVKDGEVSGPAHPVGHAAATGAGNAAFAASETSMHTKMAAASGDTVDEAYIAKMIAHHEGALEMAQVALAQSTDPEIRRMAQAVVDTQTREIAEMRAWKPAAAN
ncbi:MAG: DUF305 domain-containing protein [Alphaproteobacteria bacterium]|nr:DUF305 domain-containing protein [Alphaproteobacteria bacterium]MBU1525402.1 DUF305 domain-containing protein [Alphaproteobacteria bacterium]MBU2116291.1 DUF305 domain-containing protein [Alphaproteobacteria bacterium]MBU2351099.1 DUF305 domain-containing protein [Alphaproteobacteria bacterium]MBU2382710.1 DUF305 domain-containing protein [Alphaproteobacteria bacterium]